MTKPQARIDYPCLWGYTIIGRDAEALEILIKEIITENRYSVNFSKKSNNGAYC